MVKAVSKIAAPGAGMKYALTNDDGDFEFKDPESLEKGKWELTVLHENATPGVTQELDFQKDEVEPLNLSVRRFLGVHDERAGQWFFIVLCIALGALVTLYAGLHLAFPYKNAPVNEVLLGLAEQAENQANAIPADADTAKNTQLVAAVAEIKSTWNAISGTQVALIPADRVLLAGRLLEIEQAIARNDQTATKAGLAALRGLVENPPSRGLFWTREPFRFLEVFFWGLAGVLTSLILSSGNFLRWRRFYREGIWQHVAQIVTIPLLALVFVLLLSQVTLSLTLTNNTDLQINLSDPRLLAAVAFLIGVRPWDTWRFIRERAGQLTGAQPSQK